MHHRVLLIILLCYTSLFSFAQGENNRWMFGHNTVLDFNQSPPVFEQNNMACWEGGSVSFCNDAGNILFYSNGNQVWNRNGNVMPNGNDLLGNGATAPYPEGFPCSAAQGAVSVQSVINPDQYYLFTLDATEDVPPYALGHLRYSIIDMSLDGGLGAVTSLKNIVIGDSMTERMTLIRGEDCAVWLLTHKIHSNFYNAYKIDAAGIHPPVASKGLVEGIMGYGMLHASADGSMIAMSSSASTVEVARFNKYTGEVTAADYISTYGGNAGVCFSPNNKVLYVGHFGGLSQFDFTDYPNMQAVASSEQLISMPVPIGQMRRGPDDKIYIANTTDANLAVIEKPDNLGVSCLYNLAGLQRPSFSIFPPLANTGNATFYGMGLGQDVMRISTNSTAYPGTTQEKILCNHLPLSISAAADAESFVWNTGAATKTITVHEPGTYWVHRAKHCARFIDTFHVVAIDHSVWRLRSDTTVCEGYTLTLDATHPDIASYTWQDGSHGSAYVVTEDGNYSLSVDIKGCILSDTVAVRYIHPYLALQERDTTVCLNNTLMLHALVHPAGTYLWEDESVSPHRLIEKAGTYIVAATNICGTYPDSVTVSTVICDCIAYAPNAFTPNGDGLNDVFEVKMDCPRLESFELHIFNRYGQRLHSANAPGQVWSGYHNDVLLDAGTYFYQLRYKGKEGNYVVKTGDIALVR